MSIETDETLWPDGAQWYIKPKENNKPNKPFFAIDCIATSETREGTKITGEQYEVWTEFWEDIPRPPSPWPQVGVECEFSPGPGSWLPCKVIGKYEGFVWLLGANGPLGYRMMDIKFRPLCTLLDDLVYVFIDHYGNPKGAESYIGIAKAIMAKYELKEKTS
jgi:hypothetical protein